MAEVSEAFSYSELFLTASLITGMILIVSPAIRKAFLKGEVSAGRKAAVQFLDWAPFAFASLAFLIDITAFLSMDDSHTRVASTLNEGATFSTRLSGALGGWLSGSLAMLLGLSLYLGIVLPRLPAQHQMRLGEMNAEDHRRLGDNLRRWSGWLWLLLLYGLLPNDPYPVWSEPLGFTGGDIAGIGITLPIWFALFLLGLVMGVGITQLALLMERADRYHPEDPFPHEVGWLLAIPVVASAAAVMAMVSPGDSTDPLIELLQDQYWGSRSAFILGLAGLFLLAGTGLHSHLLAERNLKVGGNRWRGLAGAIGHHCTIVLLSTILLVYHLPNVGTWPGAVWLGLSLAVPGLIAGFLGMLLPLAGYDDRPRPELWGFRLMVAMSLPFVVAWKPLTALTLPGLLIGISAAAIIPPLLERNPRVSPRFKRRAWFSLILTDGLLLLALLNPPNGFALGASILVATTAALVILLLVRKP